MAAPKIIVVGSLNGQLEPAFRKLATLHAKNQFSLAILTGDVFTPSTDDSVVSALLDGSLEAPLPTYFTIGTHSLPARIATKVEAGEEICHNFHYLGKRSITKTSEGLRLVALGGLLDKNVVGGQSKEQHLPFHTDDDAKGLKGANSADILLTSMWPANVWNGSRTVLEPAQQASIQSTLTIADLCATLKPRYHISASPGAFFFERGPFIHQSSSEADPPSVTRFISMAPYGNEAKEKAMYAFALNKSDTTVPRDATASPFSSQKKRPRDDGGEGYSRFGHYDNTKYGRHNKRRRASPPPGPDKCYFCLSNPNISAHMCCSIGDECYITTAKGPLPTSTTFADKGLNFPGHFIIIPLPHAPTISSMGSTSDPTSDAVRAYKEMSRFRESIQAMIAARSSHKLGVVSWEISLDRNIHLIWQLMPLPAEMIQNDIAEAAFRVEAENQKYPSFVTRELTLEEQPTFGGYFRVWLWADNGEDKVKGKSLVMPLGSDTRFDLQFGRRVIAKLLGLERRLMWRECEQTMEEETADVEAFREAFKEWDFTLG
ncbi:CwfJ domain protein [Metarhizium rileyi]|uniref:CwfJ domain protein n=1 Tax=Metarhizium rileyi (strain RCEF 4871) TaxID=1649241 RepID=A0A167I6B0_METRR|nr:CwfJ domain protein [Metarhizium rileyi RCEF 4871]